MTISEAFQRTPFLLGQILEWPTAAYPDRAAIEWEGGGLTFEQLTEQVSERQRRLAALGAARFQRWGLLLGNSPDFLISLFALLRLGCVVAPLSKSQPLERMQTAVSSAGLHAVLISRDDSLASELITGLADNRGMGVDENLTAVFLETKDGSPFMGGKPVDVDPALILRSAGSSGRSRGIVLQHHAVLANIRANISALGYRDDDRTLVVLPLAHAYALVHQCLSHLAIGATVCLAPFPLVAPLLCRSVEQFSITTLATVPAVLRILIEGVRRGKRACPALRLVTLGAARANQSDVREFLSLLPHARLAITYGLTEASPRVSTYFVNGESCDPQCVGTPIPNIEVRVQSTRDGVNEIVVRGRSLMRGYAEDSYVEGADHTLHTGDLGYESEGRLHVLGRMGRAINRGGLLISAEQVERVLLDHASVKEARVESEPHPFWGEVPVATVFLRPDSPEVSEEDLARFCSARLPSDERPARITVCSATPGHLPKEQQMLSLFKEES